MGVVIVLMAAALIAGTTWSKATLAPNLALDLEGGTEVILTPVPQAQTSGQVTSTTISQAINVIRQRVNASGVTEAEVTSQGTGSTAKIVVSLPGHPDESTLKLVRTPAQMEFRPVLQQSAPTPATPTPTASATAPAATSGATPAPTATEQASSGAPTATATASAAAGAATSAAPTPTPSPTASTAEGAGPSSPSDAAYYVTPDVQKQFDALDCTDQAKLTGGVNGPADAAFVTCAQDGTSKFILGPVELEGKHISGATSGLQVLPNGTTGTNWVVNLKLDGTGTTQFTTTTTRLAAYHTNGQTPLDQFAVVLDGLVVSAPAVDEIIPNGQAVISGSFTRTSAATLANQLSFGSLPVSFQVESEQQISATLGSESLEKGLLAGLIGLVLVVVYSLVQYRLLGFLTVSSLVLAAIITYLVITLLSWLQGYRLSLPGVAGLIVAIGITADSFIVYFERIRDELRDGRVLAASVEHGWARARRTILASDTVNFLAAAALYLLAIGSVRGFAFTLGLTTIIDLVVVFFFTHPMMEIISGWRFFSEGHRFSGLDPRRLGVEGVRYAGRGRVVVTPRSPGATVPDDGGVAGRPATKQPVTVGGGADGGAGMTIAERRAAARKAATAAPLPDVAVANDESTTTEGDEH
ncbi:MAG TPA: protein translocase subunit SecD [Cellulomonas sp.]